MGNCRLEDDYINYARLKYSAPYFDEGEFKADLHKVITLKKMLRRLSNDGEFNQRIAMNHIIILLNQFGIEAANEILFYKVEREHHPIIKTILTYLNSFVENRFVDPKTEFDEQTIYNLKELSWQSYHSSNLPK